jgi:acyl carrier protein
MMESRIITILTDIRPEYSFSEPVDFIKEGMLDSFDIVRLVSDLDREFAISIDGTDIIAENFSSVEKIIALLNKNGIKS